MVIFSSHQLISSSVELGSWFAVFGGLLDLGFEISVLLDKVGRVQVLFCGTSSSNLIFSCKSLVYSSLN